MLQRFFKAQNTTFYQKLTLFYFSPSLFSEQLLNCPEFIKEKFKSDAHTCV